MGFNWGNRDYTKLLMKVSTTEASEISEKETGGWTAAGPKTAQPVCR
jgi:hypothetical protein